MFDYITELEIARLRIHRDIERNAQRALGVDPRTINRSVGQLYTRRIMALQVKLVTDASGGVSAAANDAATSMRAFGAAAAKLAPTLADVTRIGRKHP